MKRYDKYKDSGIDWIGEIPEHWETARIKYFIEYKKGKNPKELKTFQIENAQVYLAMDYLRNNPKQIFYVENPEEYIQVNDGDILLLWDGSNAGEFVIAKKGVLSSTMAVLKFNNISKRFSWYYLKYFEKKLQETTIGMGVPHVNGEELKNGIITIPTPEEQTAIANYLDHKTAQIDELIADKKRLLELYEEEKTAIINQAVTKGINPNVPMKDSGIEWLGKIPEHWKVVKFNHYVYLRHGYQFRDFDFTSSGIKIIKITQLKANGELDTENVSFIDENRLSDFRDIIINEGDILMALTGGTIGKIIRVEKVNEPLLQNYRVGNFFPSNDKLEKSYLFWVLSSNLILEQIFFDQRETGQPNIGKEDFGKMFFLLPKKEEQIQIVQYIEKETARIDAKAEKTKKLIELLKEYKQALISEVMTGKMKII